MSAAISSENIESIFARSVQFLLHFFTKRHQPTCTLMRMKYRIRMNSLTEDLYLDRQCRWTEWRLAATFSSQNAAEKFAAKHGIVVYGLF